MPDTFYPTADALGFEEITPPEDPDPASWQVCYCGAYPSESCVGATGNPLPYFHLERTTLRAKVRQEKGEIMSETKERLGNYTVLYEVNGYTLGSQVFEARDSDEALRLFEEQYARLSMVPLAVGPAKGGTLMKVEPVTGWTVSQQRATWGSW